MGKFSEVKTYVNEGMLFREEIDVILEVLAEILPQCYDGKAPTYGSFLLSGQKFGSKANSIIEFDLEQGPGQFTGGVRCSTSTRASESVSNITSWPAAKHYDYQSCPEYFGQMPTGIYIAGTCRALVVNTTLGRFVASLQLMTDTEENYSVAPNDISYCASTAAIIRAMVALVETFCQLCKMDVLMHHQASEFLKKCARLHCDTLVSAVRDYFSRKEATPALQAWRDWCNNAQSDPKIFFE